MAIGYEGGVFIAPGALTQRVRSAPQRKYHQTRRVWQLQDNEPNKRYLRSSFLKSEFSPEAWAATEPQIAPPQGVEAMPPDWPADLLPHQSEALNLAWGQKSYFLAHGMGSGKTRSALELILARKNAGQITEAWVVCPNSLTGTWDEQIARWTPELAGFIKLFGVLSLSAGGLPDRLKAAAHDRLMVVIDESQRIKSSSAKRTKVMQDIGRKAGYRLAMTGTNITKGVEDLYAQYQFLDPNILGYTSFYSFRNRYCVMGGFENKQIVGYNNLPELIASVAAHTHVVVDPVKLPPQSLEIRNVPLSAEQKRLLKELKDQMQTELNGAALTVENALTMMTRGAQIIGGLFATGPGQTVRLADNSKINELMDIVGDTGHKIVVFTKFRAESDIVFDAMTKAKIGVRRIQANDPTMQKQVNEFQYDPDVQVIVSTYSMGALGFTLTAGRVLVEYSGSFSYEEVVQARKRIHRIGQEHETKVIRLMAICKLDRHIAALAAQKQSIADFVTGALLNPRDVMDLFE